VSIVKGSIVDFANIDLDAGQRSSTPYYIAVRIQALDSTPPSGDDDPALSLQAIDDRGQEQHSVTFLGTFDRCDDATAPTPFDNGKSYQSCLAYLMPAAARSSPSSGPAARRRRTT
jgi:hypothetical protein